MAERSITVSLSRKVYARLHAYVVAQYGAADPPQLTACVRELLAQALARAEDQASQASQDQGTPQRQHAVRAFRARYSGHREDSWARGTVPAPQRQLVSTLVFNPQYHLLGSLCDRGHDYEGTGHSLRRITSLNCLACERDNRRTRYARAADARP